MKKCFFLILIITSINLFGQSMYHSIIPKPQKIELKSGSFSFPNSIKIALNTNENEKFSFTANLLKNSFKEYLNINSEIINNENGDIIFNQKEISETEVNNKSESYKLEISNGKITITSAGGRGLFYGAMSLLQLIENSDNNNFENVVIFDYPDLAIRGISDDISRGQVSTMENFKKIISTIARYKMNTFMPYIEDVLQFDAYPTIGVNRGALSKKEVKELIEYADKHYVEIVPIFQTLGHYENILSQEEFLHYAEFPGAASLCVGCEETYEFLETMLKEVFELFPSEYFHMGADESYDVGLGKSKHLVEASNIATVHAKHYERVNDICKKYGKKVLMYGDIILQHPEILDMLPKDITVVTWHYRADNDYPSTRTFKSYGINYYVSPSVWNFHTTFPTNINALPNIEYIIKSGIENGAQGMINSNWGDYGAETIKELIYYGYAWSAQCSWNFKGSNISEFTINYFNDFFGIKDLNAAELHTVLSNIQNQFVWHEVWRHPALPFRDAVWWEPRMSPVGRINWINWTMPILQQQINKLKEKVKRNFDHLNILEYYISLNNWYKLKLETQLLIQNKINNKPFEETELLNKLSQNIKLLKKLKSDYSNMWLTFYRKDNLNMIEDKFDRLISYFSETSDKIKNNIPLSPEITSIWIYSTKPNDTTLTKKAIFKKEIEFNNKPDEVLFQMIADTYAKLYINGKYIDHLHARRSLSLLVDYRRIYFKDLSEYFNPGKNIIEIEVENFNSRGFAGINVNAQINVNGKKEKLITDLTWETFSDGNKTEVKSNKYPYIVIEPNFETKRTSWIER